jgi:tetratricopeptide (TPR) repeat protein
MKLIFESSNLKVLYSPKPQSSSLVITFSNWVAHPSLESEAFAQKFLEKSSHSALYFVCSSNNWYQYPEMDEACASCLPFIKNYRNIIGYGLSMGGYAAIKFSGRLNCNEVLAISPQYSIDRSKVPWETRWAAEATKVVFFDDNICSSIKGRIHILYDCNHVDALHALLIKNESSAILMAFPHSRHTPAGVLSNMGLLQPLVEMLANGSFAANAFVEEYKSRRAKSYIYYFNLAISGKNLSRKIKLAQEALKLNDKHAQAWCRIAEYQRALGRRREAQNSITRALELDPNNEWFQKQAKTLESDSEWTP